MGNQICSPHNMLHLDISSSIKQEKSQSDLCKQIKKQDYSQDITQDDGQMDERSNNANIHIRCFTTSVNAFIVNQPLVKTPSTILEIISKVPLSFILAQTENKIKQNLDQWSISHGQAVKNNENAQEQKKSQTKLQAIKSYARFISALNPQFFATIFGQNFYKIRTQDIYPFYTLVKKIGEGSFGSVYKSKCNKTGQLRAVKILKKKIMNQNDQKSLISQINILKKLDHINIIKLYDVFFYNNFFYVVTEYCQGGNLLEALQKQKIKSEKEVAMLMKQIVSAITYMHQMNIAHRDLKLDNIVLVKQINKSSQKICIKIIDFGLAQEVEKAEKNKTGIVGTISYMAPQIFSGYYSCASDVWSIGIIMCMMLTGSNPFKRRKQNLTINSIQTQQIIFKQKQWHRVSIKAKNLLVQMLQKNMKKRIQIHKVLNHQWFKILSNVPEQKDIISKNQFVISNFNNYHRGNSFICYVKNFLISRQLTQAMRQQMALIFEKIDKDSSGVIEKQELIQLYSLVSGSTNQQIQKLIMKIDQNKSGRIDFHQFLLCMTNYDKMHNHTCLNQAFDFFDEDGTGFIQKNELFDCLEGCEQQQIIKILREADFNGDGKISRLEFMQYLMSIQF